MTRWRVTAPMVVCESVSCAPPPPKWWQGSPVLIPVTEFYRDAVLPDDVPADDIERLAAAGMIEAETD
jgi:hypothetical protein